MGFLLACGVGVCAWFVMSGTNSLTVLRSEESLQGSLLDQIPLGTSQDVVLQCLRERKFRIVSQFSPQGISTRSGEFGGALHIEAFLGEVSLKPYPLTVVLSAVFRFDEEGKLIAVEVLKTYDGP